MPEEPAEASLNISQQRRIRSTARWQQARAAARRRDGNRCRHCGSTEKLEVHHIVSLANGGASPDGRR